MEAETLHQILPTRRGHLRAGKVPLQGGMPRRQASGATTTAQGRKMTAAATPSGRGSGASVNHRSYTSSPRKAGFRSTSPGQTLRTASSNDQNLLMRLRTRWHCKICYAQQPTKICRHRDAWHAPRATSMTRTSCYDSTSWPSAIKTTASWRIFQLHQDRGQDHTLGP
jgi:hypothetical protein